MRTVFDCGIVFSIQKFSEFDAILKIFSKNNGKISLLARGFFRPKSKMIGVLQLFCETDFYFFPAKNEKSLCKLIRTENFSPPNFQPSPDFFLISEFCEKFCRENQSIPTFFNFLSEIRRASDAKNLAVIFLVRALTIFGFFPDFKFCSKCGKKFSNFAFWKMSGEIFCENCDNSGQKLNFSDIKVLKSYQYFSLEIYQKILLEIKSYQKILDFLFLILKNSHHTSFFSQKFFKNKKPESNFC